MVKYYIKLIVELRRHLDDIVGGRFLFFAFWRCHGNHDHLKPVSARETLVNSTVCDGEWKTSS